MTTLYDLLGALPNDDADGLRAAFRKAAKETHPDVNPGDPEAAERFRRIVRANAILSDEQQRAAYDQLLEVARQQQNPKPKRSNFSGTIRRLAADAVASAAVSVVLVGGYVLFRPVDGLRIGADMKYDVNLRDAEAPTKPDGIAPAATRGIAPASADAAPARDVETKDAKYYRDRGVLAYRSGDLYMALANFDLAIDMDPGLSDSYINRGIVFRRMGDLKRALSDVTEAKRLDDLNRSKSASRARAP